MEQDFPKKGDLTIFTACDCTFKEGAHRVDFNGKKIGTSAILTNMLNNAALLMQEQNDKSLKKGDKVKVILL